MLLRRCGASVTCVAPVPYTALAPSSPEAVGADLALRGWLSSGCRHTKQKMNMFSSPSWWITTTQSTRRCHHTINGELAILYKKSSVIPTMLVAKVDEFFIHPF
ncbi:hypothetical protein BS78_04G118000 [Paspalum vaginatum]|nr:hypothetical protein BS78_04G118000 [Paspalum vaginatum]KAJ1278957.1 hypothetical protein BS78_04G118000 [Paspalum vaginatum]